MISRLHRLAWALVIAILATTFSSSAAQSAATQGAAQARIAAEKAFLAGKYDEVERLTASSPGDEALVVLRAQALFERGEYAAANAAGKKHGRSLRVPRPEARTEPAPEARCTAQIAAFQ